MKVLPASVTPFHPDGRLDVDSLVRLLAWFRSAGCDGVVLAGTNGEGPSLSAIEKRDLVREAVPLAFEMPIVLGIATSSLDEAIWLCKQAQQSGCGAVLLMPPGYFRDVSQIGLRQWFESVLTISQIDVILYNFPQRTGVALQPETVAALAGFERCIGLKDSSGDAGNLCSYRQAMPGCALYVGDESLLLEARDAGWSGTISGVANVLAPLMVPALHDGEADSQAEKIQWLMPAIQALRKGPQPQMNKSLLARLRVLADESPKLPLEMASKEAVEEAVAILAAYFPELRKVWLR